MNSSVNSETPTDLSLSVTIDVRSCGAKNQSAPLLASTRVRAAYKLSTAAMTAADDKRVIDVLNNSFERGRNPSVKLLGGRIVSYDRPSQHS